jgi:hypothetical protein
MAAGSLGTSKMTETAYAGPQTGGFQVDQFHSFMVSEQFAGVSKIEKVAGHGFI